MAFKDRSPKAPVHQLVIPCQHIRNLNDLREAGAALIVHLTLKIPEITQRTGFIDAERTTTHTGIGEHQEVYHMHYHILGGGRIPAM